MPEPKTLPSIRRSGVRILPALACICLFATAARAASPSLSLHADLYSGPNAPSGGGVQEAVGFDGRHLFVTNSREEGAELWVSDGTAAGTRRLADICPGACSSDPRNFSVVGDRLYFDADDGIHGREPWMLRAGSDQPELLADMMPGIESSNPGVIRAVGMTSSFPAELRTLFVGKRPDVGRELFRIENDTVLLDTDLVPGPLDSGVDSPVYFGNRMLLTTIFAPGASGEVPVVLNYPASLDAPATPDALVGFPTGGAATSLTLYPVGNGNVVIRQFNDALWGALVGNSGGAQVFSGDVTEIIATDSGPVYFTDSVDKTLHVSDGTAAGTKAIGPAASEQLTGLPGGILAFIAPLTDSADREVWLSLGSAGLTGLYAEVVPGSAGLPAHARFEVPADGSFLYLIFNDDIWRIDDGGPQRIAVDPGFSSTFAFRAAEGPSLLFSGIGNEPFITDGLPNDVRQLADVRNDFGHSFMRPRGVINGRVIGDAVNSGAAFSAERTVSVSTASPVSVEQIETRALQEPARRLGSRLLVKGDVVLSTDGTSAGTERLQIAGKVSGGCAVVDGNQLFTVTSNNDFTMVLRQTDGTPAGTSALAEYAFSSLIAGCSPDNPPLAGMDGLLYLAGFTNTDGPLLSWDGATLSDVDVSPATSLQGGLVSLGDRLLFAASETAHGRELWRTDGTDGGAFMVKDIMPGTVGSLPASAIACCSSPPRQTGGSPGAATAPPPGRSSCAISHPVPHGRRMPLPACSSTAMTRTHCSGPRRPAGAPISAVHCLSPMARRPARAARRTGMVRRRRCRCHRPPPPRSPPTAASFSSVRMPTAARKFACCATACWCRFPAATCGRARTAAARALAARWWWMATWSISAPTVVPAASNCSGWTCRRLARPGRCSSTASRTEPGAVSQPPSFP